VLFHNFPSSDDTGNSCINYHHGWIKEYTVLCNTRSSNTKNVDYTLMVLGAFFIANDTSELSWIKKNIDQHKAIHFIVRLPRLGMSGFDVQAYKTFYLDASFREARS